MCDDPLIDNATFEAALQARYQRLSLLTLDLAQEAGEGVQDFARVDLGTSTGRFDHGIAAMTKAIWAHSVIERLRGGEVPSLSLSGGLFPHDKTPHGSHHRVRHLCHYRTLNRQMQRVRAVILLAMGRRP